MIVLRLQGYRELSPSRNSVLPVFFVSCLLLFSSGCSERDDPAVAPGSTLTADEALKEAEAKLEAAGVPLSFEEPGALMHPEDLIPDPADLGEPQKQANFEEAIALLNTVLAELERQGDAGYLGSVSDRALVHLHLGFVYSFDAISRLLISDDPEETFVIKRDPDVSDGAWYNFGVSQTVQAELDGKNRRERPLVFTVEERQAIIDAADLIDDAIVKPEIPEIYPQLSSVDRPPYSQSAIWHFQRAASLSGEYKPELMDAVEDLNEQLDHMRSIIQSRSEIWGFTYIPPVR